MSGREGIFLLFLLESGKMTRCACFSVRVESLPVFLLEARQEDPGHWQTRVGRAGAAPLLLLIIDYKSL